MQQLKTEKNIDEILGEYANQIGDGNVELLTKDGFKIVVYYLGLQPEENVSQENSKRKPKTLYGAFPQLNKITNEDLEEAKKIYNLDFQL